MNSVDKAVDKAAVYLARRDHSERELLTKLRRFFTLEVSEQAIAECRRRGWLLPADELAEKVAQSLQRKGKGRHYIRRYLKTKGLPMAHWDDQDEEQRLRDWIERRYGDLANLSFQERARAYKYLQYRGFEDALIRKVLRES